MTIYNLKENGIYLSGREEDNGTIYAMKDDTLYCCAPGSNVFKPSQLTYNEATALDFVEYIPEVDWSTVSVDTEIYIRCTPAAKWSPRYFAAYKNNKIITWPNGKTSFTAEGDTEMWMSVSTAARLNNFSFNCFGDCYYDAIMTAAQTRAGNGKIADYKSLCTEVLEEFQNDVKTNRFLGKKYLDTYEYENSYSHDYIEASRAKFIQIANDILIRANSPYEIKEWQENARVFKRGTDSLAF